MGHQTAQHDAKQSGLAHTEVAFPLSVGSLPDVSTALPLHETTWQNMNVHCSSTVSQESKAPRLEGAQKGLHELDQQISCSAQNKHVKEFI